MDTFSLMNFIYVIPAIAMLIVIGMHLKKRIPGLTFLFVVKLIGVILSLGHTYMIQVMTRSGESLPEMDMYFKIDGAINFILSILFVVALAMILNAYRKEGSDTLDSFSQ